MFIHIFLNPKIKFFFFFFFFFFLFFSLLMSELVRETCGRVAKSSTHVKINQDGIRRFVDVEMESPEMTKVLQTLNPDEKVLQPLVFKSGQVPTPVPIDFNGSLASEINFAIILDLLQLGSGYRSPLHAVTGMGASDTLTLGSVALHNAHNKNLDAAALASVTPAEVASCFNLPLMSPAPSATLSPDESTLTTLTKIIYEVLIGAGKALLDAGFADFSALALGNSEPGKNMSAEALVEALKIVPGFRDCAEYTPAGSDSTFTVWFMKKAQLAVSDLHERFSPRGLFCFDDIENLTIFVDNVIPAVLRATGAIDVVDERLVSLIESGTPISGGSPEEVELRACSIVACEEIVKYARSLGKDLTLHKLDWLLWVGGKIPRLRAVKRHFCRDTRFY